MSGKSSRELVVGIWNLLMNESFVSFKRIAKTKEVGMRKMGMRKIRKHTRHYTQQNT
jgi:hypothetical protein